MSAQLKHEISRVVISCRHCGHAGSALWEGDAGDPASVLIHLEGFYERLASKAPHAIEVVCYLCGQVQSG
jgi:hypothetical protein